MSPGTRLERHDDVFEFQCSVYDLYNRGGVIDQYSVYKFLVDINIRPLVNHEHLTGEYVHFIRGFSNDVQRPKLDEYLAAHYVYDPSRDFFQYRADDVSG